MATVLDILLFELELTEEEASQIMEELLTDTNTFQEEKKAS